MVQSPNIANNLDTGTQYKNSHITDLITISTDHSNNDVSSSVSNTMFFNFKKKGLHIAILNIQHILPKMDELKYHLSNQNTCNILGIVETYLTQNIEDKDLIIDSFNFERRDRQQRKGGGVLVYIKSNIPYQRRFDLENNEIESIWIEIKYPACKPFLLNFVYRPPDSKLTWIEAFENQFDKIDHLDLEVHILGDFNINFLSSNSVTKYNNKRWDHTISKYGLAQMINSPTRITKSSSTIIDHIYSTRPDLISDVHVPLFSISDHYPVCFTRSTCNLKSKQSKHENIKYRSFKSFSEPLFCDDLAKSPIRLVESVADPNQSLDLFYSILNSVLYKHAPIKERRVRFDCQPGWFNSEIKEAICLRDKLHKHKQFNDYKTQRNKVTAMIKSSKRNFYNNAIKDNKSPSFLWKHLNSITNRGKDNILIPDVLTTEKCTVTGSLNILNELNKHFVNISNIIQKTLFMKENFSMLQSKLDEKLRYVEFNIEYITAFEVKKHIDNLDVNKSTGIDGIGPKILKYCGDYITSAIASIINNCIDQNVFPDLLKQACVIPIHKGGDKNDPHNYRPISILPTISKIFEMHISNQIQYYFKKYELIHETQSGFRQHHSCQTALTHLIDSWLKDVDSGKYVGAVFLDLRKAFDLVDHEILLHKLKLYHFSQRSVEFFSSYLSNRRQLIKVKNKLSDMLSVTSGVPQGSILGPLLFLLYINDITFISNSASTDLYADDTTIYEAGCDIEKLQNHLQLHLNSINEWCILNNMALHPTKTKCMLIGTKCKVRAAHQLKLKIDDLFIENVTCQKVLGVYIDNTLSWNIQLSKVCAKLNSKISLLKRISYYLSLDMKQLFYNAYILPTFDYCCTVWGGSIHSQNTIYKAQKRVARIILNKPPRTHSQSLFNELQWLSFSQRYQYHVALLVYKSKNGTVPQYIIDLISFSNNKTYSLRSADKNHLTTKLTRTNNMKMSFGCISTNIWNKIPLEIKNLSNIQSFKRQFKMHLFHSS